MKETIESLQKRPVSDGNNNKKMVWQFPRASYLCNTLTDLCAYINKTYVDMKMEKLQVNLIANYYK